MNYQYKATPLRVIDGDTIDFMVDLGFKNYQKIRIRVLDIDTPEIRGPEKVEGKIVKTFVQSLFFEKVHYIQGKLVSYSDPVPVTIQTRKTGKYGRWLAVTIFDDGETLVQKIKAKFPEMNL